MDYFIKEDIIEYIFEKIKRLIFPSDSNNYKSRFLQSNFLLCGVILLLALKIVAILVSINFPQNIFFADITKSALENFVNQERQSIGLPPLIENQKLNQAAQSKAENMVQDGYFSHISPSGVTPWSWFLRAGYNYKYAGENLAIGFYGSKEVYDAWLNSPSHKANIVNPNYTEVGTAVLDGFGQNNTIVVVQEFGSQLRVKQTAVQPKIPIENRGSSAVVGTSSAVKTNEPTQTTPTQTQTTPAQTQTTPAQTQATPAQTQATPAQTQIANINEQVLSQSTESQSSLLLNFVLYNFDGLLQDIIYGVSSIVIGVLLALIFFNINFHPVKSAKGGVPSQAEQFNGVNFRKELVFRAVLIMVLLSVATLLNKEVIIALIPHQVLI